MNWRCEWRAHIASALAGCGAAVEQTASGRWSLTLSDASTPAVAWLTGDWLCLDRPLASPQHNGMPAVRQWLMRTAQLPDAMKYVLTVDGRLHVRTELTLADAVDLPRRLVRCIADLDAAVGGRRNTGSESQSDFVPADLGRLCSDAAWPFTLRDPTLLMVPLEVGGPFVQAAVQLSVESGVIVAVPVPSRHNPLAGACEQATGILMLRTSDAVRLVRATIANGDQWGLAVHLGQQPAAAELAHALSALSIAWRLAGPTADVLARDDTVAMRYCEAAQTSLARAADIGTALQPSRVSPAP